MVHSFFVCLQTHSTQQSRLRSSMGSPQVSHVPCAGSVSGRVWVAGDGAACAWPGFGSGEG